MFHMTKQFVIANKISVMVQILHGQLYQQLFWRYFQFIFCNTFNVSVLNIQKYFVIYNTAKNIMHKSKKKYWFLGTIFRYVVFTKKNLEIFVNRESTSNCVVHHSKFLVFTNTFFKKVGLAFHGNLFHEIKGVLDFVESFTFQFN